MPIRITISHPDRLVMGIATGDMTLQDFIGFGLEIQKAGLLHYRKIIDGVAARPAFSREELRALVQYIQQAADRRRGALAFVIDPYRGEFAKLFSEFDGGEHPVRVFRSIHDARKWLADNPPPDE